MSRAAYAFLIVAGASLSVASAQSVPLIKAPQPAGTHQAAAIMHPQKATLSKFMRPVTVEFNETRLEDAMRFVIDLTQADVEVYWQDDRNTSGLDKETLITLKVDRVSALALVEKILEKASTDTSGLGGSTWQLSETGTMQIGPKERLNRFKRVELYPIHDLLLVVPDYTNAPQFDLQAVLQSTGQGRGGGGGQSPFRENNQNRNPPVPPEQRAQEVQDLIVQLVEPEQWVDNGGDGASSRYFQGSLIVNAPDYVHRGINGYPYWPAQNTKVAQAAGRRYVTLGVDTATSKLLGFEETPISVVVGGRIISSDPNRRGPGGSIAPATKPGDGSAADPNKLAPAQPAPKDPK